mmetsp:Transcript_6338/g.8816  ORF Transcript_6338/g.8816 Transcript_6338/m.8816 type:complete len:85 (-) Transcript_6338:209-463(-)
MEAMSFTFTVTVQDVGTRMSRMDSQLEPYFSCRAESGPVMEFKFGGHPQKDRIWQTVKGNSLVQIWISLPHFTLEDVAPVDVIV